LVLEDVMDKWLSVDAAKQDCGVVIDVFDRDALDYRIAAPQITVSRPPGW
jgi:hypothetical protein